MIQNLANTFLVSAAPSTSGEQPAVKNAHSLLPANFTNTPFKPIIAPGYVVKVKTDTNLNDKKQKLTRVSEFWQNFAKKSVSEQKEIFGLDRTLTPESVRYFVPSECRKPELAHITGDIHGDLNVFLFPLIKEHIDILPGTMFFDTSNGEIIVKSNEHTIELPNIRINKKLPKETLLFLGDFIDRGSWSSEIIALIYVISKLPNFSFIKDSLKICIGNHETALLLDQVINCRNRCNQNIKKFVRDLVERDVIKCAHAVNGVLFAHSYLTEETLKIILENLEPGSTEYQAAKYFLENKDKEELFKDAQYTANLEILVSAINRLFKIYISQDVAAGSEKVKGIFKRDNGTSAPDGLFWQRYSAGKQPIKCIQFGYGHECNPHRATIMPQAKNAFDFDGSASYAISHDLNYHYSQPQEVTFYPDGTLITKAFRNAKELFPNGEARLPYHYHG